MPGESGDSLSDKAEAGVSSLQKLIPLQWDETTEIRMLRSRLDEQSQLICLLKRRADDAVIRCQGLEGENEELERKRAEAASLLVAERKRADQLEDRFGILAANHQEMIRYKDDYKRQNAALRAECQSLREGRSPELLEKEQLIQGLRAQLHTVNMELERRQREEIAALQERLGQLQQEHQTRSQELLLTQQRLKDSEEECHKVMGELCRLKEVQGNEKIDSEKKVDELNEEKAGLLHLCMERGRSLQERQKEVTELSNSLQHAKKSCQDAEDRYRRDLAAVDADARIVELNMRLVDSEKELGQLRREFEAYKKHTGELLAKERELNAKLRHLIG